jgi:hypothetical protein
MTTDNNLYKLIDIVSCSVAIIEQDGEFKGNSNTGYAGDTPGYRSTKDKVIQFVTKFVGPEVTEEHRLKALDVIKYFSVIHERRPLSEMSDFLKELNKLSVKEDITKSAIGYAVAMVPTYDKFKLDEEFYKNSEYVGVVGTRSNFFLKLLSKKYIRGAECYLYTFMDRRQNVVKTWVTMDKEEKFGIQVKDCVDLDAYVNKHEANKYNEVRETYINRIKIIENKGAA